MQSDKTHTVRIEKIRKAYYDFDLKKEVKAKVLESYTEPFRSIYNAERRVSEILDHNFCYPQDPIHMRAYTEKLS